MPFILLLIGPAAIIYFIARDGLGISMGDSVAYLQMAENIRNSFCVCIYAGCGKRIPIEHWPWGYPLFISFLNPKVANPILAFITNVIILKILEAGKLKGIKAYIGVLVVSLSPVYINVFTHLWSEALFVPILLLTIYFWIKGRLIPLTFLTGAMPIIRYSGIFSWVMAEKPIILVLSTLPFIFWKVRNMLTNALSWRDIAYHPPNSEHLRVFSETLYGFFGINWLWYPESVELKIAIFTFVMVFAILVSKRLKITKPLTLLVSSYGLLLTASITFYDHSTTPNLRILSPIYFLSFILIILAVSRFGNFLFLSILSPIAYGYIRDMRHYRVEGYNSIRFSDPKFVEMLKGLKERYVYSNAPDFIWYRTGIYAEFIPRIYEPHNARKNPNFYEEIEALRDTMAKRNGVIVWINGIHRGYLPDKDYLVKRLKLRLLFEGGDGSIWVYTGLE
ncbi:MAG: hypothetical protein ABIL16_03580 [candidate division WOR-3 bacterium]